MNSITEEGTDCQGPRPFHLLKENACIPYLRKSFERKEYDLKYSVCCQTLIRSDLPGFKTSHSFLHLSWASAHQTTLLSLCDFMRSLWLRITKFHLLLMQHSHLHCTIALHSGSYFRGLQFFLHPHFMCCCDQNARDEGKTKTKKVSLLIMHYWKCTLFST